jgi:beta-lactamase class A
MPKRSNTFGQMKKIFLFTCLVMIESMLLAQKHAAVIAPVPDLPRERVEAEIARLSLISGGIVGISAIHVESGKRIDQNNQVAFPMASCFKVPVAAELLTKVDSGLISLDQMIEIEETDLHPGSGIIANRFDWPGAVKPGIALSVRSLLELMLLISDNSAADICLRLAGGPPAVNASINRLGITGIRIDRPTSFLISDSEGIPIDKNLPWSPAIYDSLSKNVKPEDDSINARKFDSDLQDISCPAAMTDLLLKLFKEPVLKPASQTLLLDIMKRCETGLARLKGSLPPGTEVMHKTGTIGMSANDVGIITLPGDAGHVVISVFVKSSEKATPERERAIAEVTRTIYDYFIFNR